MDSAQEALMDRLVASPASVPKMDLDTALARFSAIGFRKFEVWTNWANSAFDIEQDPAFYLAKGREYGLTFPVVHLETLRPNKPELFERAVKATRFAKAIGAGIVSFKARPRALYIEQTSSFLDAVAALGIHVVVQNHANSAIETLDDVREVHDRIADERLKALLEVGHFHTYGVGWKEACDYLGDRIVHVHVWDRKGAQAVPFGTGEIDLPALFRHLTAMGYTGDFLVEMEIDDQELAMQYFGEALVYLREHCAG